MNDLITNAENSQIWQTSRQKWNDKLVKPFSEYSNRYGAKQRRNDRQYK